MFLPALRIAISVPWIRSASIRIRMASARVMYDLLQEMPTGAGWVSARIMPHPEPNSLLQLCFGAAERGSPVPDFVRIVNVDALGILRMGDAFVIRHGYLNMIRRDGDVQQILIGAVLSFSALLGSIF